MTNDELAEALCGGVGPAYDPKITLDAAESSLVTRLSGYDEGALFLVQAWVKRLAKRLLAEVRLTKNSSYEHSKKLHLRCSEIYNEEHGCYLALLAQEALDKEGEKQNG